MTTTTTRYADLPRTVWTVVIRPTKNGWYVPTSYVTTDWHEAVAYADRAMGNGDALEAAYVDITDGDLPHTAPNGKGRPISIRWNRHRVVAVEAALTNLKLALAEKQQTELEEAVATGTMVTATYTNPTTGWTQRVEVLEVLVDAARIRNTMNQVVQVPTTTLDNPQRLQGDNREYLPRTTMAGAR